MKSVFPIPIMFQGFPISSCLQRESSLSGFINQYTDKSVKIVPDIYLADFIYSGDSSSCSVVTDPLVMGTFSVVVFSSGGGAGGLVEAQIRHFQN
jgi:hypothetical protein